MQDVLRFDQFRLNLQDDDGNNTTFWMISRLQCGKAKPWAS